MNKKLILSVLFQFTRGPIKGTFGKDILHAEFPVTKPTGSLQ